MRFTYDSYRELLQIIRDNGYAFCGYHDFDLYPRCAILRHDIDNSPEMALRLGQIEQREGIHSTFFTLLTSDFYNPASLRNLSALRDLLSMGHEIGLHFDETVYAEGPERERERDGGAPQDWRIPAIQKEAEILSALLNFPVKAVSMHRPSKAILESDLRIPGIVNSYSELFFREFKYLSDSRRHWREPAEEIIRSGKYNRLQILTHAFWYHDREESMWETVTNFIRGANRERYQILSENISDLSSVVREEEI